MLDGFFLLMLVYSLLVFYSSHRVMFSVSLIPQFIVNWLVTELAVFHAVINGLLLVLALLMKDSWSFWAGAGFLLGLINIVVLWRYHQAALQTTVFERALRNGLGEHYLDRIVAERKALLSYKAGDDWKRPFSLRRSYVKTLRGITYGPNERNTLDIHLPRQASEKPRPVMLQIHGGGWVLGYGERQGLPLRNKLVEAGWIFVSINYRLSPKHTFPDHLIDCKQSLHWIKTHIAEYGGDPHFVLATGGSAGGHLCSLLALTANRYKDILQPGFEDADTAVQGCLPMYGVYDFCSQNPETARFGIEGFLEKSKVMPALTPETKPLWEMLSPVMQVTHSCPPFMVINGTTDTLTFVENARFFVDRLHEKSKAAIVYAEVERAPHGFDIFYSPHCVLAINAMHRFAEWLYSHYLQDNNAIRRVGASEV
ncbi:MAG: alpha/beta hydrolase [Pseudomonadales bacterium]|nr:alpha/beta hydrolase [Pseudomonadales bacterium]